MSLSVATVGMAEAKTNFSKLHANANATGLPITVFKNNKPWVEIRPLATPRNDFKGMPAETIKSNSETEDMWQIRARRIRPPTTCLLRLDCRGCECTRHHFPRGSNVM